MQHTCQVWDSLSWSYPNLFSSAHSFSAAFLKVKGLCIKYRSRYSSWRFLRVSLHAGSTSSGAWSWLLCTTVCKHVHMYVCAHSNVGGGGGKGFNRSSQFPFKNRFINTCMQFVLINIPNEHTLRVCPCTCVIHFISSEPPKSTQGSSPCIALHIYQSFVN